LALLAKDLDLSLEDVKLGISYIDPEGRLDVADVRRQIGWFKMQGMVKPEVDTSAVIDTRFVMPVAER